MTNDSGSDAGRDGGNRFDLEEWTALFGESIVRFAKRVPVNEVTRELIGQLVRAATSVGGNYCEADEAGTRKEFRYRISVCKRESRESGFQLRMIVAAEPQTRDEARPLWQESKELTRIFAAILRRRKDP